MNNRKICVSIRENRDVNRIIIKKLLFVTFPFVIIFTLYNTRLFYSVRCQTIIHIKAEPLRGKVLTGPICSFSFPTYPFLPKLTNFTCQGGASKCEWVIINSLTKFSPFFSWEAHKLKQ